MNASSRTSLLWTYHKVLHHDQFKATLVCGAAEVTGSFHCDKKSRGQTASIFPREPCMHVCVR